jgi:hypothetical protein
MGARRWEPVERLNKEGCVVCITELPKLLEDYVRERALVRCSIRVVQDIRPFGRRR